VCGGVSPATVQKYLTVGQGLTTLKPHFSVTGAALIRSDPETWCDNKPLFCSVLGLAAKMEEKGEQKNSNRIIYPSARPPLAFENPQGHIFVALRTPRTASGQLPPKSAVQPAAVPVWQVPSRQPPVGSAAVGAAGSAV
jgi:hypothetical protein